MKIKHEEFRILSNNLEKLSKRLCLAGLMSRKMANNAIYSGDIKVFGTTIRSDILVPDGISVTLKNIPVNLTTQRQLWAINKPRGIFCTTQEKIGVKTLKNYLYSINKDENYFPYDPTSLSILNPLPWYGEGLLLLSNDGRLKPTFQDKSSLLECNYHIKVYGKVNFGTIINLRNKISHLIGYSPTFKVRIKKQGRTISWLEVNHNSYGLNFICKQIREENLMILKLKNYSCGPYHLSRTRQNSICPLNNNKTIENLIQLHLKKRTSNFDEPEFFNPSHYTHNKESNDKIFFTKDSVSLLGKSTTSDKSNFSIIQNYLHPLVFDVNPHYSCSF